MCRRNVLTLSAVVALFATAVQAADSTDKCHSGKLKESAKYACAG